MRRTAVVLLSLAAAICTAAAAQGAPVKTAPATFTMSPEYRTVQQSALETRRKLVLSMADSMPEALYRDHATPIQRDFAQQLHHIVSSESFIAGRWIAGKMRPESIADTAVVFSTRAGMKAYITREYDYLAELLKSSSDASRNERVELFGQTVPRWQVWDEIHQHTIWTAGQVVANFRKNGMAPPAFLFF